jgi:hypothetical protein
MPQKKAGSKYPKHLKFINAQAAEYRKKGMKPKEAQSKAAARYRKLKSAGGAMEVKKYKGKK